jgi:hypothetical protein
MLLDKRTIIIEYVPKGNYTNFVSTLKTNKICASNLNTYNSSHNFIEINLTCLNEN